MKKYWFEEHFTEEINEYICEQILLSKWYNKREMVPKEDLDKAKLEIERLKSIINLQNGRLF